MSSLALINEFLGQPANASEHGFQIDGGYGKIKGSTFRISNMGDETTATLKPLLAALSAVVERQT